MLTRSLALLPLLTSLACTVSSTPPSNPPSDPPAKTAIDPAVDPTIDPAVAPAATPAPANYSCTSDDECTVSCKREDNCCGKLCECDIPYHRDQLDRIIEDHKANCKKPCPVARCSKPKQRTLAQCVEGTCAAVKAPWVTECTADDDCVTSCMMEGNCCGQLCRPCNQAYHKADLAVLEKWHGANCAKAVCGVARCKKPDADTNAVCRDRQCAIERVPIK